MFKKISFFVAALFAVTLMGCEQQKNAAEPAAAQGDEAKPAEQQPAGGKIENAETGALTPGQEAPAPAEAEKKAE